MVVLERTPSVVGSDKRSQSRVLVTSLALFRSWSQAFILSSVRLSLKLNVRSRRHKGSLCISKLNLDHKPAIFTSDIENGHFYDKSVILIFSPATQIHFFLSSFHHFLQLFLEHHHGLEVIWPQMGVELTGRLHPSAVTSQLFSYPIWLPGVGIVLLNLPILVGTSECSRVETNVPWDHQVQCFFSPCVSYCFIKCFLHISSIKLSVLAPVCHPRKGIENPSVKVL